jgi:hypothetical protein
VDSQMDEFGMGHGREDSTPGSESSRRKVRQPLAQPHGGFSRQCGNRGRSPVARVHQTQQIRHVW